eukprot:TRINITY_DN37496_c0_g1_i1.p1 TRINITY_DN37496_c0_g1~~TRINITY_DN37496_c0_g1_i1.p1  ORF type:complete len:252 (-),score=49.54 TRINITY_DN37496_c0_g1_i1:43-714(-)
MAEAAEAAAPAPAAEAGEAAAPAPAPASPQASTVRYSPKSQQQNMMYFGSTPQGDRLRTHTAMIGHLRNLLQYEFPMATNECQDWADNLRRVASAPLFPPPPEVPCPPPALVHPSSPGIRRNRAPMPLQREHYSTLARASCGDCSRMGCCSPGLREILQRDGGSAPNSRPTSPLGDFTLKAAASTGLLRVRPHSPGKASTGSLFGASSAVPIRHGRGAFHQTF